MHCFNKCLGIVLGTLVVAPQARCAHWTADHVTIVSQSWSWLNGWGQYSVGGARAVGYSAYCYAPAVSTGPSIAFGSFMGNCHVLFFIDYIKDSPSDPDAPDSAIGSGTWRESADSDLFDGSSTTTISGSTAVASVKGAFSSASGGWAYGEIATGATQFWSDNSGPMKAPAVFPFKKNWTGEPGTLVCEMYLLVPSGNTTATAMVTDVNDFASALAALEARGGLTLEVVNGQNLP